MPKTALQPSGEISLRRKVWLWAIAWGTAAIVMTIGAPGCWLFFWDFPLFIPPAVLAARLVHPDIGSGVAWYGVMAIGWLYYVLLSIWGLRLARRRVFYWAFIVLCVSLLLNCAGCQAMLHADWSGALPTQP